MADRVREIMEAMVPELEDLQRRKLCSPGEVKQLAKRRERFEYLAHRPSPTRDDFLRYLELEMNFSALLRLRRRCTAHVLPAVGGCRLLLPLLLRLVLRVAPGRLR